MNNQRVETGFGSIQWFIFLLANSLAFPIIIGQVYHLSADEISSMLQRTFFVVGLGSFLAGWLGHRFPLLDGPAGVWLSAFIVMGDVAMSHGSGARPTLQLLEGGMLASGIILVLISITGTMRRLLKLFTPLVTGSSLMVLGIQLSGTLLKGMVGADSATSSVDIENLLIALGVFIIVLVLTIWGNKWLKTYAILIGMVIGWMAFGWANGFGHSISSSSLIHFPKIFAWGTPTFSIGMLVSSLVVTIVLISNIITSVSAMELVFSEKESESRTKSNHSPFVQPRGNLSRSSFMSGVSGILSALFSTVGVVPVSLAASFVQTTRYYSRKPYFIACTALVASSFFPMIYHALSTLPGQIAYAALLPTFTQIVGIGLKMVLKSQLDSRRLTILGLALSLGLAVMFIPSELISALPVGLQFILGNGMMVGTLIALFFEHIWRAPIELRNQA
ncbi:purine/pyrimidine permease [Bacillus gobiensis]|uniref:purine/pyrimidine permease n=1 Tax=Bacillus gobiensis TaxID=1441095 RepID=UPI003D1FB406